MARGNNILVSAAAFRGVKESVIIEGTPKPGTWMTIKAATPVDGNGRHTFQVYQPGTDGEQRPVAILLPDWHQGKTATDAYADGEMGQVYYPEPGEFMNVLVANITGTGSGTDDVFAVGDLLIGDSGTGKFIKTTGTPESEPFEVLETVADTGADQLVWVRYTGH